MDCPNCGYEKIKEPLLCSQCAGTFCPACQPYWDHTSDLCQGCQEFNSIEAVKESTWTGKLRRWFSKKLEPPEEPGLRNPLPWSVAIEDDIWAVLDRDGNTVAHFLNELEASYACQAAASYHDLSCLAVLIHNRIRNGDPYWTGGKEDCTIWTKVRSLIK